MTKTSQTQKSPATRPAERTKTLLRWVAGIASAVSVLVCLGLAVVLASEQDSVAQTSFEVGNGVPVTMYVPGAANDELLTGLPSLPDPADRPPVVVLAHGFSGDRMMTSVLARRLVAAGYAVMTPDFRGHGANDNAFSGGADGLREDLDAVLDSIDSSPYIDPDRVVIMGHSMGAGAVVDLGFQEDRADAVVALSGGWPSAGPEVPKNTLFVLASGDPDDLKASVDETASDLAGVESISVDETYGSVEDGSAVRLTEVDGTDHLTILWSEETARRSVEWLDDTFGIERDALPALPDPRLGLVLVYTIALIVVIAASGWLGARLSPAGPAISALRTFRWTDPALGLAGLIGALVLAAPVIALGTPTAFVPLAAADALVGYFAVAGLLLWAARAAARSFDSPDWLATLTKPKVDWPAIRRVLFPALVTIIVVMLALAPVGIVLHGLTPTLKRLLIGALVALLISPFAFGFNLTLRRGPTWQASASSILGRVVVIFVLLVASGIGLLPSVVELMVPVFVVVWFFLEVLAAVAYAHGKNAVYVAVVESFLTGLLLATTLPVTI